MRVVQPGCLKSRYKSCSNHIQCVRHYQFAFSSVATRPLRKAYQKNGTIETGPVNTPPAERAASGSLPEGGIGNRPHMLTGAARPVRDGMIVARHVSAGKYREIQTRVPEGRLSFDQSSLRDSFSYFLNPPGTCVPGYYHRVPPGRKSERQSLLESHRQRRWFT
jgi:hypothetical protein